MDCSTTIIILAILGVFCGVAGYKAGQYQSKAEACFAMARAFEELPARFIDGACDLSERFCKHYGIPR